MSSSRRPQRAEIMCNNSEYYDSFLLWQQKAAYLMRTNRGRWVEGLLRCLTRILQEKHQNMEVLLMLANTNKPQYESLLLTFIQYILRVYINHSKKQQFCSTLIQDCSFREQPSYILNLHNVNTVLLHVI